MKKQTKNTLKVLSTLALASAIGLNTVKPAEAKNYKPEVRYDNGEYFVKTSDPSATGKHLNFLVEQNDKTYPYAIYEIVDNYKNQEVNASKILKNNPNFNISDKTKISIHDDEIKMPDAEGYKNFEEDESFKKDLKAYYSEVEKGVTTIKESMGNNEGKVETPQPTKPVETPVKPKEEKKETPKTTTPTETPKTTQTPTTPEKKVTDKKETPTPKATQTQEKTTDNKQVTEKKETTAKPLPKTTAETFGELALYTFGGLSLLSILAFFGLRKKQK